MTFEPRRSGDSPLGGPGRLIITLFLVLVLLFVVSLSMGRFNVAGSELATFLSGLLSGDFSMEALTADTMVIWWLRVPRCLMAIMVGMSLSLSGAVYQGLFRNPLVSPDILGVAAGCTFGAALGLVMPGHSFALVHLLSFAFGLLAVYTALGIARLVAVKPVIVLVLAGMVVLSFFNALLMAADDAARSLTTSEIPVGIITALAGAPVFAYLLFRNRGSGWM